MLDKLEHGDWGNLDVADDTGSGTADGVSGSEWRLAWRLDWRVRWPEKSRPWGAGARVGVRARPCSLVRWRGSDMLGGAGADVAEFKDALLCIRIMGLDKFELVTGVEGLLYECEGAGRMSALLRGRGGGGSETTGESGP